MRLLSVSMACRSASRFAMDAMVVGRLRCVDLWWWRQTRESPRDTYVFTADSSL